MRCVRFFGVIFCLIGGLFCNLDRASAQGDNAARQACAPDAMRLCGDVIPDVAKIAACMQQKKALLSDPCRLVMNGGGGGSRGGGHGARRYKGYHHYARHRRHSA